MLVLLLLILIFIFLYSYTIIIDINITIIVTISNEGRAPMLACIAMTPRNKIAAVDNLLVG